MSKIRQSLFLVLLSQAFLPLAAAQTAEKNRTYGINLGLDAARTWTDDGTTYNNLNASGALLFLNEHFHFGPSLSYARGYTSYFSSTTWGLGVTGKWTYENIQTASSTPFVELGGFINKMDGGSWESSGTMAEAAVGYEMFLNQYVSLAPSIKFRKGWEETEHDVDSMYVDDSRAETSARLHLGVNVYL